MTGVQTCALPISNKNWISEQVETITEHLHNEYVLQTPCIPFGFVYCQLDKLDFVENGAGPTVFFLHLVLRQIGKISPKSNF